MYIRTITGTISKNNNNDLKAGEYAIFTVDTDTGAVTDGRPVSGVLTTSATKCYSTTAYLALRFDEATGNVVANTEPISGKEAIHAEEFILTDLTGDLLTAAPESMYLCVVATDGRTTNKINFRDGCTYVLEITYTLPPELIAYTDPTLTAGETHIKAVHMTELQTNINLQRGGLALAAWPFETIRAGYTSLAGWTAHVEEMRAAIDDTGVQHEAWIEIAENCPTAAVIEQLRRVVEALLL